MTQPQPLQQNAFDQQRRERLRALDRQIQEIEAQDETPEQQRILALLKKTRESMT